MLTLTQICILVKDLYLMMSAQIVIWEMQEEPRATRASMDPVQYRECSAEVTGGHVIVKKATIRGVYVICTASGRKNHCDDHHPPMKETRASHANTYIAANNRIHTS
jgi:hypothetical protein